MEHAREKGLSERRACRLLHQPRGTQRYQPTQRQDEGRLTQAIIALACQYGRYGYRRITALLQLAGWFVGKDRVQRIWRREGLKVPARQKPRGRLWLHDGSCIRLRPERQNHVWSYDFVEARTHDGRSLRLLTMIDEFTRECLAIRVARRLNSLHVIEVLGECMLQYGLPENVRSDNGAEMTARRVKQWLRTVGTRPMFIEPGSPWETGSCESFNGTLRDPMIGFPERLTMFWANHFAVAVSKGPGVRVLAGAFERAAAALSRAGARKSWWACGVSITTRCVPTALWDIGRRRR